MKYFFFIILFLFSCKLVAQVGIQTSNVDPSAILELNTSDLATGNKKGFLGPRVSLTGNLDVSTIPTPATGLLVYNLADAGTFPNNVLANRYYFWNGSQWVDLGITSLLQNYLSDRLISLNSTSTQNFSYSAINNTNNTNGGLVVSFADSDVVVNSGSVATKSDNTFIINITGLYEVSAYVNYNPNRVTIPSTQRGCFLNLKLQRSTDSGSTWTDVIGNRTAWSIKANNLLKTAILISTPIYLKSGQRLRLVVQNPFTEESSLHGENDTTSPLPMITTSSKLPISKSFTLLLMDYDLQ